jgi:tRNA modification GTPase
MRFLDDTIAAIASPPGGAARGIVRLSGPGLRRCLENCFRPDPYVHLPSIIAPTAVPGFCWLSGFASPVPSTLYLWPGRRSYTGQSVAEIHTLGSPPILEAIVRAACAGGARPAEPGEFTLRAFLAGRIDLTQAEAVLGVIDAVNPSELHAALAQLAGGLAQPMHRLRNTLLDLLAHLEAGLDFADEDLPFIRREELTGQLDEAAAKVDRLVQQMARRGETTTSVGVVLLGRPNSGKSSLFNALAEGAGAIVSDRPGTTRDYLTAELDLDGVKCRLIDTAGVEAGDASEAEGATGVSPVAPVPKATLDSIDEISQSAQQAALEQSSRADVRVLCIDATRPMDDWERHQRSLASDGPWLVVFTKIDLAIPNPNVAGTLRVPATLETSVVTGEGLRRLRDAIRTAALHASGPRGEVVAGTAVRCADSLRLAAECLHRARATAQDGGGEELVAAEIRVALDALGKVAGAVYTEDVLDRIFSRFCIGK